MARKIELVPIIFLFERIRENIPTEKNTVMNKLLKKSELIVLAINETKNNDEIRIIFFIGFDISNFEFKNIKEIDMESNAKNGSFIDWMIYSESSTLPSAKDAIKNSDKDVNVTTIDGVKILLKLMPFTSVFSDSIHPTGPTD